MRFLLCLLLSIAAVCYSGSAAYAAFPVNKNARNTAAQKHTEYRHQSGIIGELKDAAHTFFPATSESHISAVGHIAMGSGIFGMGLALLAIPAIAIVKKDDRRTGKFSRFGGMGDIFGPVVAGVSIVAIGVFMSLVVFLAGMC